MVRKFLSLFLLFFVTALHCPWASADVSDPLDPFDVSMPDTDDEELDKSKTPEQLIAEAEFLMEDERFLDARTKLLRALQKDPKAYRAHMLLAGYYMVHVGHFRLSLKYVKQAEALFKETVGLPPYKNQKDQLTHAQLLYLLSQARLNLDDYSGSLQVLDEFLKYGYFAAWYPGTRAWVLMKMGAVDEAIRVARLGILAGAEPGRTLNMLGILLSMHGDREESLRIFRDAIAYELSQGRLGQPATPLNNSGEVYKEIFEEERAESSWLKATSMPDGCEHVLPSLNLALMYIDQINLSGSQRAIDNFESCVAQYPLRNGEEHIALVGLARGRIAFYAGNITEAIQHFEHALQNRQWFGKIGTSEGDLKSAALISLGQAYRAAANRSAATLGTSLFHSIQIMQETASNRIRSWWYLRKARQTLALELKDLEDMYVRNTDSLIEYPTFGEVLSGFNRTTLKRKITNETQGDSRKIAKEFYESYLGESLLTAGSTDDGLTKLRALIPGFRPKFDDLLNVHVLGTMLQYLSPSEPEYAALSERLYTLSRPSLRNYGAKLVVYSDITDKTILHALNAAGFITSGSTSRILSIGVTESDGEYELVFVAPQTLGGKIKVRGPSIEEVVNRLSDNIFVETVVS